MKEVKVIGFWTSPYIYRVHKKVPVFVHRGKTIAESMIILEYIDETWPQNPLLLNDPHAKVMARLWTKFGDKKQNFIRFYKVVGEEVAIAVNDAQEHLRILEEHGLGEKKFFDGNEIGMTDLSFGWKAFWLKVMEETAGVKVLDVDSFPR